MKPIKALLIVFLFLLLNLFTPLFRNIHAQENKSLKVVKVSSNETVNKDYFAVSDVIEISGTVNGDVYAAGGIIIVNGTINGDLLAVGGTISISGKVKEDARIAGGEVNITGTIGNNLTSASGNIEIGKSAVIYGGLLAGSGNILINGPINGYAKIAAGNLTLANKIGGDLEAGVAELRISSNAEVMGNITYWSDNNASIDENAQVSGLITKREPAKNTYFNPRKLDGVFSAFKSLAKITGILTTLITGVVLIKLFPKSFESVENKIRKNTVLSTILGFGMIIFLPILIVLITMTIIGAPLGIFMFSLLFFIIYCGRIFIMYTLGSYIFELTNIKKKNRYFAFLIGLLIYNLLTMVKIFGALFSFFAIIIGFGATLFALYSSYQSAKKKDLV